MADILIDLIGRVYIVIIRLNKNVEVIPMHIERSKRKYWTIFSSNKGYLHLLENIFY